VAESLLEMGWSIRFHPAALFTAKGQPIDCLGLSMGPDGISGFPSREAAVAWILRYLDARIVDTGADLSALAPTCFVELTEDSHG
jgi:hypothetical protein